MSYAPIAGPWRAEGTSVRAIDHGQEFTVAGIYSAKITPEGRAELARFIARAPEAFDLLDAALEYVERFARLTGEPEDGDCCETARKIHQLLGT